jgi:two-component system sensor histidine kinase QseC
MRSLQGRLILYIIGGAAAMLLISGIALDRLVGNHLKAEFDKGLLVKAMTLVAFTELDGNLVEFDFVERLMPEYGASAKAEYFQLWLQDNRLLARSPSLGDRDLPRTAASLDQPRFLDLALPDARRGRAVSFSFIPQEDAFELSEPETNDSTARLPAEAEKTGTSIVAPARAPARDVRVEIAVAKGTEELDSFLAAMRYSLAATFLLLALGTALLVHFSVRHGLKPLRRIAAEVRRLDSSNLQRRIESVSSDRELAPIVRQLNQLLERLDAAFQRERRFSGNVAHELRTPIAELRTIAEVGRNWPADEKLVRQFFSDLVNLGDDMERTVTNLLMLARLEAGQQPVEAGTVDLAKLIEKSWRPFSAEARKRKLAIEYRTGDGLQVATDGDKLALILTNLFSNAVSYSPEGSVVVTEVREAQSRIHIDVSNPTIDLTVPDLPLMFERFWRKDSARTQGRHAGLGLSLVQALAAALHLEINPQLRADGKFTITISGLQANAA